MLDVISKEFWPILWQELKGRREEVRMIALEEMKREAEEKEEIERQQNVKQPASKWHQVGRPRGSKNKT